MIILLILIYITSDIKIFLVIYHRYESQIAINGRKSIELSFETTEGRNFLKVPPNIDTCILQYDIYFVTPDESDTVIYPVIDTLIKSVSSMKALSF